MSARKICLFTAHSPLGGGGGVILRSLVAHLPEFEIDWKYTAEAAAPGHEVGYLGRGLVGGSIGHDIWQTGKMLAGASSPAIEGLVTQLLATECDGYWIVSHNEGLRVAVELARRQKQRPVHLTFHDDWEGALCARSLRYRWFGRLARKLTVTALREVSSFDVISQGMQDYYHTLSAKNGPVCHRYLPAAALEQGSHGDTSSSDDLTVGHIGSIYDRADLVKFLAVLQQHGCAVGSKVVLKMWGCHLRSEHIPSFYRDSVRLYPPLAEAAALNELRQCDFVYAMYPQSRRLALFSRTSLPTKLTSYVQAGRPILSHAPAASTLARFVAATGVGENWTGNDCEAGRLSIKKVLSLNPTPNQWNHARQEYFGEKNLAVMSHSLVPKQSISN